MGLFFTHVFLQCLVGAPISDWPPYPPYAQSVGLEKQYRFEADRLTLMCNTYDRGSIEIREMTEQVESLIAHHLTILRLCRETLGNDRSFPGEWIQACPDVLTGLQEHARLDQQLQAHIARMDQVLPSVDVQRQILREGEEGVTKRLATLQNTIREGNAIQTKVCRMANFMSGVSPCTRGGEPLESITKVLAPRLRAQLFRDAALYLLDVADAPLLARRAIVSARATLSTLQEPENVPEITRLSTWPQGVTYLADDFALTAELGARIESVWQHELDVYAERRLGRSKTLMPANSADATLWEAACATIQELDVEVSAKQEEAFVSLLRLSCGEKS